MMQLCGMAYLTLSKKSTLHKNNQGTDRMKMYFLPVLMLLTSCAMSLSPTGEPGISMGDSYEKVLAKLQTNHVITKEIAGEGIRAEGYSSMLNSCRVKYFIFHISRQGWFAASEL